MILSECDSQGVATITFNRPEKRNAFDEQFIQNLQTILETYIQEDEVRLLVIKAAGDHFSAGADLKWMQKAADFSLEENKNDARQLAKLLTTLQQFPKPTFALVQGGVMGGGLGIIACCDIVLAEQNAFFCFSEARLGLAPAIIAPFVLSAIPMRLAKQYMLTAEKFNAEKAVQMNLVQEVYATLSDIEARAANLIKQILQNGPNALIAIKNLLRQVATEENSEKLLEFTVGTIAQLRVGAEGQQRIKSFLGKK